jgi:hypothetical protein
VSSVAVESARQEWEEAYRRLQGEAADRLRYERLMAQIEVLTEELRRRVGQTFTLAELAETYAGAERWARPALAERAPAERWALGPATVEGAAFHLYARGATDYSP